MSTVGSPRAEEASPPEAAAAGLRSEAMRGAALLAARQAAVALVTFAGVVALSLLLPPGDFGLYGYVTTTMLVAASVGDLGLGAELIRSRAGDRQIREAFGAQLGFWLPVCVLGGTALAVVGAYGFSALTVSLLFAALLLLVLQTLPTAVMERRFQFGRVAAAETAQRVLFVAAAVAVAAIHPTEWAIPLAAVLAATATLPAVFLLSGWRWPPVFRGARARLRGFSGDWWQSRVANQLTYAAYPLLGGILFTSEEVGLLVWALAITAAPALLAPTVARAFFPALARSEPVVQKDIYRPLFRALLLVGMPLAAAIFAAAEPLTLSIFGEEWRDAIPLLRLESVTTVLGLALTPLVPFLFLALPSRRVRRLMVASTAGVWICGALLAPLLSYRSISVAQIVVIGALIVAFDLHLRRARDYSPLADMAPAAIAFAVAAAAGLALSAGVEGAAAGLAVAGGVAVAQAVLTWVLGGGVDPRVLLEPLRRRAEVGAGGVSPPSSP